MFKPAVIAATSLALALVVSSTSVAQEPASPSSPPADSGKPATPSIRDGQALLQEEEFDEAADVFRAIVAAHPDNAQAWHYLGYSLHAGGHYDEALPIHLMAAEFPQNRGVAAYNVACVYALKGKNDQAFAWLEKSRAAGFRDPEQLKNDSDMDNLKDDPRFDAFVQALEQAAQAAAPGSDGIREIAITDDAPPAAAKPAKSVSAEDVAKLSPEHQLDFWIGSWDVFIASGAKAGSNRIEPTLDGRMLLENWASSNGGRGKSMNYYDAARKQWVQVWVDATGGSAMTFGSFKDGAMRTAGETVGPDGKKGLTRSVLTPNADGTVRQFIENSDDAGKTWTVYFDGTYKPSGT